MGEPNTVPAECEDDVRRPAAPVIPDGTRRLHGGAVGPVIERMWEANGKTAVLDFEVHDQIPLFLEAPSGDEVSKHYPYFIGKNGT